MKEDYYLDYVFDFTWWLEGETILTFSLNLMGLKGVSLVRTTSSTVSFWLKNPSKRTGVVTCIVTTPRNRVRSQSMSIELGRMVMR